MYSLLGIVIILSITNFYKIKVNFKIIEKRFFSIMNKFILVFLLLVVLVCVLLLIYSVFKFFSNPVELLKEYYFAKIMSNLVRLVTTFLIAFNIYYSSIILINSKKIKIGGEFYLWKQLKKIYFSKDSLEIYFLQLYFTDEMKSVKFYLSKRNYEALVKYVNNKYTQSIEISEESKKTNIS